MISAPKHMFRERCFESLFRRRAFVSVQALYLTEAKLECAYRLLTPAMAAITACNGGNTFRLPHSGMRKEMRGDGWEI